MTPVSFIAISFLYFFFRNPDSLICVSNDRDSICTQQMNPVCALYSSTSAGSDCDSPTGYCLKTMNNTCEACSDPSIIGYILGDCPHVPVQTCSQEHSQSSCSAMKVPGSVCGITEIPSSSGGYGELSKTVLENGCEACNAGEASFYLGGETLGECVAVSTSTICKPADRNVTSCEGMTTPVCAYYTGGNCDEEICRKTMDSNCLACLDSSVMFYFNGDCADLIPIGENGLSPDYNSEIPPEENNIPAEQNHKEYHVKKSVSKKIVVSKSNYRDGGSQDVPTKN